MKPTESLKNTHKSLKNPQSEPIKGTVVEGILCLIDNSSILNNVLVNDEGIRDQVKAQALSLC